MKTQTYPLIIDKQLMMFMMFSDMIVDMKANKKISPIDTELCLI